jgi:hypothetical protein
MSISVSKYNIKKNKVGGSGISTTSVEIVCKIEGVTLSNVFLRLSVSC